MQLIDVATASAEVGASSARLAKIARIADLLTRAGEDGDARQVAVIVSWLSGDLPQRQIGVGWAALRSLPQPAQEPTLAVDAVDAAFTEIGAVAGKGSQSIRAGLVADLFSAATDVEQTFLRRLLGGELRQGALAGVMADAVAKAAGVPAPTVRRAAMLGGDLPAVAAAALTGGETALSRVHAAGRSARSGRCWPRPRPASVRLSNDSAARRFSKPSSTEPASRSTVRATTCRSTPAASTTSPPGCPRSSRRRLRYR